MFEKGFTPNCTEKVFTISSVKATKPSTYTIKDTLGEPVQGTFYEQDLQLSYRKSFVLSEYSGRRKIKFYVKWKGYCDAFNLWVVLTDLKA